VQPVRLAGAIVLSRAGAYAAVVIAGVACIAAFSGQPGTVASFLPVAIGIVFAVWRQFNGEFGTTVAAAPDGLRLRSGLVQTTAETIRPGRVQAVRLVEPLVWRAFGWCRLEVDVAGVRSRHTNRAEAQRLRALIPVGSRAEAERMLGELIAAPPSPSHRAASRARWKAPLKYHFLAWGGDGRYAVTSEGRVCRRTTWVPLEKVQSIRWVQGPVQRGLGLASVRLDVAGKRVRASIQDRTVAEADDLLRRLPDLARAARAARSARGARGAVTPGGPRPDASPAGPRDASQAGPAGLRQVSSRDAGAGT
jgi:putative membrane protein